MGETGELDDDDDYEAMCDWMLAPCIPDVIILTLPPVLAGESQGGTSITLAIRSPEQPQQRPLMRGPLAVGPPSSGCSLQSRRRPWLLQRPQGSPRRPVVQSGRDSTARSTWNL